ncbi:MAG: ABC transporter substrate-binding protein [Burkholderiales bacterium]|nr:ABC transporter substrate-binding protein [Burkholderiales bacterium]
MSKEIKVVQVVPITGAVARDAKNVVEGVKVGIAATNSSGGIRGVRVEHVVKDDRYQPESTVKLLEESVREGAVAAIMPVGSASMMQVIESKILQKIGLPVVGVVPGSESLRQASEKWIFHTRASDDMQVSRIVRHAITIGQRNFAVLYGDIPFGLSGMRAIEKELAMESKSPVYRRAFSMANPENDLLGVETELSKLKVDAIVVFGGAMQSAKVLNLLRQKKQFMSIYALSYADVATVCDVVGSVGARGVAIAQVVPNHKSSATQISRQFTSDWNRFSSPRSSPSQYAMEGYIAWKVLERALSNIDGDASGQRVKLALEGLGRFSIGGFAFEFSGEARNGSSFVDIGVVDRNCNLTY